MDLDGILAELYARRQSIDRTIAEFEKLMLPAKRPGFLKPKPQDRRGRGRKSMDPAERLEVSARMRRYWDGRRKAKAQGGAGMI